MECALMGRRFHRGFTAAEKAELWDGWKREESLKAIGRAFGNPSSSIYFLVAPHGGIRPAQRRRKRDCRHDKQHIHRRRSHQRDAEELSSSLGTGGIVPDRVLGYAGLADIDA
jgi:IS30 family transposase